MSAPEDVHKATIMIWNRTPSDTSKPGREDDGCFRAAVDKAWDMAMERAAGIARDARTRNTVYDKARRDAAAAILALKEHEPTTAE